MFAKKGNAAAKTKTRTHAKPQSSEIQSMSDELRACVAIAPILGDCAAGEEQEGPVELPRAEPGALERCAGRFFRLTGTHY